ncbi:MAG: crotonase/enoyl-CoA hydratase family protein [Alphaproteobacteria bacterium]|nr:MAG: crotonase/enoyl-CoA hydratase family protein [Alphaproteobacteria bacterium]
MPHHGNNPCRPPSGHRENVRVQDEGPVRIVTIERPEQRNAVDMATAETLHRIFLDFEADENAHIAILTGAGGHFCAGADLKAIAENGEDPQTRLCDEGAAPMGPTRLLLSKPVIAAIEGHAVAGGLELACWCDLRVAARDAVLGVFCRRFGVPLVDLGSVRLPRLIGHSRAMDLILTGRPVSAEEAWSIGLVNRLAPPGAALADALKLARELAAFPQECLRNDRLSAIRQWGLNEEEAWREELRLARRTLASGETLDGARRFATGAGRHGRFADAVPDAAAERAKHPSSGKD